MVIWSSSNGHAPVDGPTQSGRTVHRVMFVSMFQRLGNQGAVDNAHRSCHEHDLTLARIEAMVRRVASMPSTPGMPGAQGPALTPAGAGARRTA